MSKKYHQYSEQADGSVCVRVEPGDPWTVIAGEGDSQAYAFANQQNKFWKPWMKESIRCHAGCHDDEDDTFSRRVRKPK